MSPSLGLEVADGEQGDRLGLAMLPPSPDSGAVPTAGTFVLNPMMALLCWGQEQWLSYCSSMAWITVTNERGGCGGSSCWQ